ncbi:MAG: hypothetical protein [Olavius algarvensis Gamma 1 endosymbiont]|nr:MAG: hypothetical protein [Olavius algarvensis Gamma 1 endosymbiont]
MGARGEKFFALNLSPLPRYFLCVSVVQKTGNPLPAVSSYHSVAQGSRMIIPVETSGWPGSRWGSRLGKGACC